LACHQDKEISIMRLFILLLLQVLLLVPFASFASDGGKLPIALDSDKTAITEAQRAGIIKSYGKLPLYFIENKGQADKSVRFFEQGSGHTMFFARDGVVLALTKNAGKADKATHDKKLTTEILRFSFAGSEKNAHIAAGEAMPGHVNYFVGNDKTKWRSNIPTYGNLTYKDLYKNIDIKFYGNNNNIEHDIIVRPGGDPSLVKFVYNGIKGLNVTDTGDLEILMREGTLIEQRPVIYQKIDGRRVAVEGSYRLLSAKKDGMFAYGFKVASYDHTKELIIDPVLVYSTYLGGSARDFAKDIAVDSTGSVYVTGQAASTDFPIAGAIQGVFAGGSEDVFVTKINSAGSALVYSTYLGGGLTDLGESIAIDSTGAAYVTGMTRSTDFPVLGATQGAFGGGGEDAFVTKINPAGSAIVYSTYLGGNLSEFGFGIALDNTNAVYVTGLTTSLNFPLVNPIQSLHGGGFQDAFVTKINPAGSAYVYSTYLGGGGSDAGNDIAVDASGAAYVTGQTASVDFPVASPLQGANAGGIDAFLTKIDPAGAALVYSTYLGGSIGDDIGSGIALDSAGSVYVTGDTSSINFPTVAPIQALYGGGLTDAFVLKLNAPGTALIYSTFIGGTASDFGRAVAVDSKGIANVIGETFSGDFPLVSPIQATFGGVLEDAFVSRINAAGSAYLYSTYLGGNNDDMGFGIAVDITGNAYVTGGTASSDFPLVTPIQPTLGGGGGFADAFVGKITDTPLPVVSLVISPDTTTVPLGGTLGYNVTATNTTAVQQCFNYWENVTLPSGATFPAKDSLIKPVRRLCLAGGTSTTVPISHGVPITAPAGTYVFNSYVGIFPFDFRAVVDTASFTFNAQGVPAPTPTPRTSWRSVK